MPKLAKIRLTGCKYAAMTKEHENSIFDLTKDGQADHTLFTLINGGGKGVMMQLIFQLLLPETRWGKNNGNKVISMFYDNGNSLHPFTSHVVLEWILDTIPERRLITGIALKPILKNTGNDDEEEKTGLYYFLYTHEHDNTGFFSVENLPLFDEVTRTSVDVEKVEEFIDEYKNYFTKYSQSSVRRKDAPYFTYLESRGIHRSDWESLKRINKSEGGVTDYFAGASDNKSIFDKIIIPVISEHIKNYSYEEEDSLVKMFKSNLSITKDLPVLIKREGDYKELLVEIRPLIENADSGSRFWDIRERCIAEGNDICFILSEEETRVTQEIDKWSQEAKRAENERKELAFEKDNLIYNREKNLLEAELLTSLKLKTELNEKSSLLKEKQAELELYEINEILVKKKDTEEQINLKREEKQSLMEALDIADIKLQADRLDAEIQKEWEETLSNWQRQVKEYYGYTNYLKQEIHNNNRLIKQYEERAGALEKDLIKFEMKEDELVKERQKLEVSGYDPLSLFYPEKILEDLINNKTRLEAELEQLNEQMTAYQEQENKLGMEINQLEYRYEDKLENKAILEERAAKQEKHEIGLARRVTKRLWENYEGGLLTRDWFAEKLNRLEDLEKKSQENLEKLQKTIWEKNIDQLLNQEDYFIPNKDVVLLKEEILHLDIYVETGAEYLHKLDDQEKASLLSKYPEFLFSLVIQGERDWNLIEKNINNDLFLNNMVPIYIRSMMGAEESKTFKSITGKAIDLIDDSKYLAWQEAMQKRLKDLSSRELDLKDDLQDIANLKEELRNLAKSDTAWIINKRIKEEEREIAQLIDEIRAKKEEKLVIVGNLKQMKADLFSQDKQLKQTNDDISRMTSYIEKFNEVEQERKVVEKIKQEHQQFQQDITHIKDVIKNLQNDQEVIDKAYWEWRYNAQSITQAVKVFFLSAEFKEEIETSFISNKIPNLSVGADKLLGLLQMRKVIEDDIDSKNTSIAVIDEAIKHLNKKIDDYIKQLQKISVSWQEYPYLHLSISELEIRIHKHSQEIAHLKQEINKTQSLYDRTMGRINTKKEQLEHQEVQILKEHGRPAVIREIEDIADAMDSVERDIQSNYKYALICKESLQQTKDEKMKLSLSLSKVRSNYDLDVTKGKMDKVLKERIQQNPDLTVEEWLRKYNKNRDQISKTVDEGESFRTRFIKRVEASIAEDQLREKIITTVKEAKISNFKSNLVSFKSMENHFQQELLRLTRDKTKAEEVMRQWTHRASIHVLRMVEALREMVASMNYINEQGYAFPLVKLKGAERLPQKETDINYLLNEYFVQAIAKIIESKRDITTLDDHELKELMGDQTIFSKALQGRYPVLLVYKMSEKNEFRYAKARDEYYTTWEAINKGEGYSPEGSGGQTLSVTTFVIMMLISFKNRRLGNENPSNVLIMDNPFGQASSRHVLDPIFEIADKLNSQLICFASPDIIKVGISERFPIFWELKIEKGKIIHGGRVIRDK